MKSNAIKDMHKFYSDSFDAVLEDLAKNKEDIMRIMFLEKTTGADISISFRPIEPVKWSFTTTHCSFKETKINKEIKNGKEKEKSI